MTLNQILMITHFTPNITVSSELHLTVDQPVFHRKETFKNLMSLIRSYKKSINRIKDFHLVKLWEEVLKTQYIFKTRIISRPNSLTYNRSTKSLAH